MTVNSSYERDNDGCGRAKENLYAPVRVSADQEREQLNDEIVQLCTGDVIRARTEVRVWG